MISLKLTEGSWQKRGHAVIKRTVIIEQKCEGCGTPLRYHVFFVSPYCGTCMKDTPGLGLLRSPTIRKKYHLDKI